jgi:hypothetical protein
MEYVYLGASIECDGAEIVSRKINFGTIVYLQDIGNCRKYECERNSESIIKKELTPKYPLYKKTSHLDLGDKIRADTITVYIKKISTLKIDPINKSGRHKAQLTYSKEYTFSEIIEVFPNQKILNDPRQVLPAPKKLLKEVKKD